MSDHAGTRIASAAPAAPASATQSPLLSEAQKNTQSMLAGMLRSLGFKQVTVSFS